MKARITRAKIAAKSVVTFCLLTLAITPLFGQPSISLQPTNLVAVSGSNAVFSVTITGAGPYTYQWQFNGTNLPDKIVTTLAGNGQAGYTGDGPATTIALGQPLGMALDPAGNLYVAENLNNCVRKINTNGQAMVVVGKGPPYTGGYSGDGGLATNADQSGVSGVALDSLGNLYVAANNRLRKVDAQGYIQTIAGDGTVGFAGDGGPATNASFYSAIDVALDTKGNYYLADSQNGSIRRVDTNGIISTVAGIGLSGFSGDEGPATNAMIGYCSSIALDHSGALFIADTWNQRIRMVDTNGIIHTVAGGGPVPFPSDGTLATNVILASPEGVTVDDRGNLYFTDSGINRVYRVDTNSVLTTYAGNGTGIYSGDGGSPTDAGFAWPLRLLMDSPSQTLYIADNHDNRIRKVFPYAILPALVLSQVSTNQAGDYRVIVTGSDGRSSTSSVATLTVVLPPSLLTQPASQTVVVGSDATFTVAAFGTPPFYYQWLCNSNNLANATNATLSLTNVQRADSGAYAVSISNTFGVATSSNAWLVVTAAPPRIVTQPLAPTAWPGVTVSMSVAAVGSPPLAYQWRFKGTNIANATNTVLTLSNAQFTNNGSYTVVVTNDGGSKTSSGATLTVSQIVPWGAGLTNSINLPISGQSLIPAALSNAVAVAGGGYHSLAILPSGKVTGWGYSSASQASPPSNLTNAAAIAAGLYHSVALRSNGTVTSWGQVMTQPSSATNGAAIAAGWNHSILLRSNGTLVAWYVNSSAQYGQGAAPTNLTGVAAIAAGGNHNLVLRSNGTVTAWGWNAVGQTNVPGGLSNVVAIAAGGSNSVALKHDGAVVCWGDNTYGQTNVPSDLSNVVAIAAGNAHILALKNDGTLVAWGLNDNGQTNIPSALTNVTSISAGAYHNLSLVNIGPPTFLSPILGHTVLKGEDALLSAAVLGTPPMSYQWLHNWAPLATGTSASLLITNAQLADAGSYQLIVSNSYGSATSAPTVLAVNDLAPQFQLQPTASWVLQNSNITLLTAVSGIAPITYQWLFNGAALSGATNANLIFTNAQTTSEGFYSLFASNSFGTALSSNVYLNVVDLTEALDATNLVWANMSTPPWYAESSTTHDGFAAAAVGPLTGTSQSSLQATVIGPGTATFWWMYKGSQLTYRCYVDGSFRGTAPFNSWGSVTVYLGSGTHVLTWTASQSGSLSASTAYLDQVNFTPGTTPVTITTPPANQTNYAGSNVTFTVSAIGTPPISYQWYSTGGPLAGASTATLTLNNIQSSDAGSYYVTVDNGFGPVASSNATLTVIPSRPWIVTQPIVSAVMLGGNATFSGSALGTTPLAYQWLHEGSPVAGATASSLTLTNVQYVDGGNYSLLVSNSVGTAVSSNALLIAYALVDLAATLNCPAITWGTTNVPWFPETNVTHDGISAAQSGVITGSQQSTLQGTASGPATLTFWWKVTCDSFWDSLAFAVNGTNQTSITGTVDWQLVTNYLGAGSQTLQWNLYPVHGAFAGGTGWVDSVQLMPGGTAAAISVHPASSTNNAGNNVILAAAAVGTPPLQWQWQFNGTNLPGATGSTLTLTNVQLINAGVYALAITNDSGSAVSSNATVLVTPSLPTITLQPTGQVASVNGMASFFTAAKGSAPLGYQWLFNGTPISGATDLALNLANVQTTNSGAYLALVTNAFGTTTSAVAVLTVDPVVVKEFWPLFVTGYPTPSGLGNVVAVAAGASHTVALREDGTVRAWGTSSYGQTNVPSSLSNVIAVVAGLNHTAALKSDGTVVAWGDNSYGQLLVPSGLSNVTALAAAANHTLALRGDGSVIGWGNNANSQLNVPEDLNEAVAVGTGIDNGFAVKLDGTLVEWGNGPTWQENGNSTQLNAAAGSHGIASVAGGVYLAWVLQNNGTLTPSGVGIPYGHWFIDITACWAYGTSVPSEEYVAMLTSSGQCFVAGYPFYSQFTPSSSSYPVFNVNDAFSAAVSYRHAAVAIGDGAPRVARRISNQSAYGGSLVVFSSGVVGRAPLSYQWRFNGADLPGATNALLVLSNVLGSVSGNYACVVSNSIGVVTGAVANLAVQVYRPSLQAEGVSSSLGTNRFSFRITGQSGLVVIIETSSNLVDWTPIQTNALVQGEFRFMDSQAKLLPARFYRARYRYGDSMPPLIDFDLAGKQPFASTFGFSLSGRPGQIAVVETSTNLVDWVPAYTNTLLTGFYYFTDPATPPAPSKFYRMHAHY